MNRSRNISWLLVAVVTTGFSTAANSNFSQDRNFLAQRYAKQVQIIKQLAICEAYFSFALNAVRRDPRLHGGNLYGQLLIVNKAALSLVDVTGFTKDRYYKLKSESDTIMYSRTDRETRRVGILVDEFDIVCQTLADQFNLQMDK